VACSLDFTAKVAFAPQQASPVFTFLLIFQCIFGGTAQYDCDNLAQHRFP